MLAARGDVLRKLVEAAQEGDPLSIVVLIACLMPAVYVAWLVIKALMRTPQTSTWRLWRVIGLISLSGVVCCIIGFGVWTQFAPKGAMWIVLAIFIATQVTVAFTAYSARRCREEFTRHNSRSEDTA